MTRDRRTRDWELPPESLPMAYAARAVRLRTKPTFRLPSQRQKATTRASLDAIESALPVASEVAERKRLLEGARRGDPEATETLFRRYRMRLIPVHGVEA